MAEVIAAALDALEDNDNHAATVILKTAQRGLNAQRVKQGEQFCDANCTWLDHAPGCDLASPTPPVSRNPQE